MSKNSIARDRWRQLGQTRYADFCPSCGFYAYCNHGQHRTDCQANPPPTITPKPGGMPSA